MDRQGKKVTHRPKINFEKTARVLGNLLFQEPIGVERGAILNRCAIGAYTFIGAHTEIIETSIGNYCSIGPGCRIGLGEHPTDWLTTSSVVCSDYFAFFSDNSAVSYPHSISRRITIGNDVWIGASSVVKDGVVIGDGAIIGAGSVVTKNVPPYAIIGGVPARLIRLRFSEAIIERLLQLEWWKYDLPKWGRCDGVPRLGSLTEFTLDRLESSVQKQEAPSLFGRRFHVTFSGENDNITNLQLLTD